MNTKSTHTKQNRQARYVPGSSRKPRSAVTLLAQVADIERGTRIRERREELHLTQPAVVELLEGAAKALPRTHDLHPAKLGKPPVTLRGYQTYEQGGGIVWEKAKLLAAVLQMDVQAMMSGEPEEPEPTPTPFAGPDALADRLDAFEALIRKQNELLERQSRILEAIEARLGEEREVRDDITEMIERRRQELAATTSAPDPKPAPPRSPAAGSTRAARQRTP